MKMSEIGLIRDLSIFLENTTPYKSKSETETEVLSLFPLNEIPEELWHLRAWDKDALGW